MFQTLQNWVSSLENVEETIQALNKVGEIHLTYHTTPLIGVGTAGERQGWQE